MSISTTRIDGADIRFTEAAHTLRRYVGCFWVLTSQPGATIRVIPDGTCAIGIERRKSGYSEWFLRGPLLQPHERQYSEATTLIGVRLRPGVAFMLSRIAAHSLVDRRISLDQCAAFRDLVSIDIRQHTPEQCIETLQTFLIHRLKSAIFDNVVATALAQLDGQAGAPRIADLAARCGVSTRHLNRRMRQWVGFGPKRYAGVVRFQATLMQMEQAPQQSVAILASDSGYYDQSHLTTTVGRLAGATPGRMMAHDMSDLSKTRCNDLP